MYGKSPTRKQKVILENQGLHHKDYVILKNLVNTMIVQHRVTGEIKVMEK